MGSPLSDITMYGLDRVFKGEADEANLRRRENYVCDLYHTYMNGYKPPKTSRICLHFDYKQPQPFYVGSILQHTVSINETEFGSKSEPEQNIMLLNVLHNALMELVRFFSWDEAVFSAAYAKCIENDLKFVKEYPSKKSRNRKLDASVVIKKDERTTYTYIQIVSNKGTELHNVFTSVNYYWYDGMYSFAKHAKWINSDSFGFSFSKGEVQIFYSISENCVKTVINPIKNTMDSILNKFKDILAARTDRTDFDPHYESLLYLISRLPVEFRQQRIEEAKKLKESKSDL